MNTESDGKLLATFKYKKADEADSAYTSTVPTAVGSYKVRATIPETDTYLEMTCEGSFAIKKISTATATVSVPNSYVGDTYAPSVETESDGKASATFEYKEQGALDSTYSSTQPTAAGSYTVRVTVPATEIYPELTDTADFTISKKTAATAEVTVADIEYGGTIAPSVNTESDGKALATFEYKKADEADSAYAVTVPTAVGSYKVRATIPETATYNTITCEGSFAIRKISTATVTVSVQDSYVGDTYEPSVTTESDGKALTTYEYKTMGAADTAYSSTKPTAAGSYTVRVTVPATEIYPKLTNTADFTISRKTPSTATVSVADIVVGEIPTPEISTDSDGKDLAVVHYKKAVEAASAYTTVVPTAAGSYMVRATIPETDTYLEITCEDSFEIKKISTATVTVTVPDSYVGDTYEPSVTTESDGKALTTYEYKVKGTADITYGSTKPTAAGSYTVRANVPETDTYLSVFGTADFTISRKTPSTATVSVADIDVGGTVTPVVTTDSDGKALATFEYKTAAGGDGTYAATVPTAAGSYMVRATIPETNTYNEITCEGSFVINKISTATVTVTVPDSYVGDTYEPAVTTTSDGKALTTYEYKVKGAADTTYSSSKPMAAGSYTVRATVPETASYLKVTGTADFTISKRTPTVATVSVADIEIGGTIVPVVNTDSDGKALATFEYKKASEPESAYAAAVPTAGGSYSVRATIPETDTYNKITCEGTFTIRKKTPTYAMVTVTTVQVGNPVSPVAESDSDGAVTYEYKAYDADDSGYMALVPVSIGTYKVRATFAETDTYLSITCENSFSITDKLTGDSSVSVNDIKVGEKPVPMLKTESDGKDSAIFEYKKVMDPDTAYTSAAPVAAGKYMVRATIPETAVYAKIICESTFNVTRNIATASVKVSDIQVGGTVRPVLTTDSDGKSGAVYEYKPASAADTAYSKTIPTAAGSYKVLVTIPETDAYEKAVCEGSFTIRKKTAKVKVSAADIRVGEGVSPILTTDSDGKNAAVFEYKASDAKDSAYTTKMPTAAGTYKVRASVPETSDYEAARGEGSFSILRRTPGSATVTVKDLYVGGKAAPIVSTDSDGKSLATFKYKPASAAASAYTEKVPTAAGTYSVRAYIPETDTYQAVSCEGTFAIRKKTAKLSISMIAPYAGAPYRVPFTTDSDGADRAVFEYWEIDAVRYKVNDLGDIQPHKAGYYRVKVVVPETDQYEAAISFIQYEIGYLTEPKDPYQVSGNKGKNGFYTEDVTLMAPEGYLISSESDGTYSEGVVYAEGMTKLFLKRKSDGAMTDEISLGNIKIDKEAPKLLSITDETGKAVSLTSGAMIYADTLTISLEDENLASVRIGNMGGKVEDKKVEFILDANGEINPFTIVAEDLAGNTYEMAFTLLAAWRKTNLLPAGVSITLETGKEYRLGTGRWKVDGNPTIYVGNQKIYVNQTRKYKITTE